MANPRSQPFFYKFDSLIMMPSIPSVSSCSSVSFICNLRCKSIERTTGHQGSTIFLSHDPSLVPAKTEVIKQITVTHETIVEKHTPTEVPLWRPSGLLRVLRPLASQPLLQQFSRGPMRGHLWEIRQQYDKCAGKL